MTEPTIRFSVAAVTLKQIYGQVNLLLRAGAELVDFFAPEPDLAATFARSYPQARQVASAAEILEDPSIQLIVTASIPSDRAPLGIAAMRHGKDFMSDKPGFTTLEQLAEARRVQAETGRIYSICFSERFENPATVKAGELVAAGAIGRVIQMIGLGPHRINSAQRPSWFFERERYGGILTDIASHQGVQGTEATGYIRVDWFTPDGLPTMGDFRLILLGTDGYIEVRKNVDIAGRPGANHLFLVDQASTRYIDCADTQLPYGRQLVSDILNRTETAMPQAHCFLASELALRAEAEAQRLGYLRAKEVCKV